MKDSVLPSIDRTTAELGATWFVVQLQCDATGEERRRVDGPFPTKTAASRVLQTLCRECERISPIEFKDDTGATFTLVSAEGHIAEGM